MSKQSYEKNAAERQRALYVRGLKRVAESIGRLLDQNGFVQKYNGMVSNESEEHIFSEEERKALEELKKEAEDKAEQIENNNFIVAVIGRTSSGKSLATNVIVIGKSLLPVSNEECTRAKTEIRYDEKSRAEVTFYSMEEFRNNFLDVLNRIPTFPESLIKNESGSGFMEISGYQNFKSQFEKWVKENENNKTQTGCKEIRGILDNIDGIWDYLGKERKLLDNVTRKELETYIANEAASPAVKEIVIYSPILEGMKNAIFKDMPGYGSSMKTFSTLSAKTMIDADAVLLVREALEVYDADHANSVFAEALSLLKTPEEKRRFTEKIFFFLNKADVCYPEHLKGLLEQNLNRSMEILERTDSEFKKIVQDHTVIGSALAFTPEDELDQEESESRKRAKDRLQELGLYKEGDTPCIQVIRNKLQRFNDTVRQKVRIEEAEAIQAEAVSILNRYRGEYVPEGQIDSKFRENYKRRLTRTLNDYNFQAGEKYNDEAPAASKTIIEAGTTALEAELENFNDEDTDWKEIMFTDGWSGIHGALPMDYYFRGRKRTRLKRVFENAMKNAKIPNLGVFDPECTTIFSTVQKRIILSMDVEPDGLYYKELYQAVGDFLDNLDDEAVKQAKLTKLNLGSYVDDLFTLLITTPYHSAERWDFFNRKENRKDFYELDRAYRDNQLDGGEEDYFPLITDMLFHKKRKEIASKYEKDLLKILEENGYNDSEIKQGQDAIERIALKKLDQTETITFPEGSLADILEKLVENDKDHAPRGYVCKHYKEEINYKIEDGDKEEISDRESTISKRKEDVKNEFKADLKILIDALKNALPYCIQMEKDARNIVQNLCDRINQLYKDSICDWIEQNQNVREWMLQSRSQAAVARNTALHEVDKSYMDMLEWISDGPKDDKQEDDDRFAPRRQSEPL